MAHIPMKPTKAKESNVKMMEDFWIWKSNICQYEGINIINKFLDISGKEVGLSFIVGCSSLGMNLAVTLRLFNNMSLES